MAILILASSCFSCYSWCWCCYDCRWYARLPRATKMMLMLQLKQLM